MSAMIGPIRVKHTNLRHRRISVLFRIVIILNMLKILKGHCKSERIIQLAQSRLGKLAKAVKHLNVRRLFVYGFQRFRLYHAGLSGIDRIDAVCLDPRKLLVRNVPFQQIRHCGADDRFLAFF